MPYTTTTLRASANDHENHCIKQNLYQIDSKKWNTREKKEMSSGSKSWAFWKSIM